VEPEKTPLLGKHIPNAGNSRRIAVSITIEDVIIARQQLGKQLLASARNHNGESIAKQRRGKQVLSTMQTLFSVGLCKVVIKETNSEARSKGAHRFAICTWLSNFRTHMII
jgi:hypothetical protein